MKNAHPKKQIIRQYLLGRLDDQQELEEQLSTQMFFDDELSQMVDSIEDEILDEYLDGTLSPADMQSVKEYFLLPQQRQDKLQFTQALRRYCDAHPSESAPAPEEFSHRPRKDDGGAIPLWSNFRTYVELAALIVLSISCLIYVGYVRHQFQADLAASQHNLKQLEDKFEQERQRSVTLAAQVRSLLPPDLTLVDERSQGVYRSPGEPLEIKPTTEVIKVEVGLKKVAHGKSFDVALEPASPAAGNPLWSIADVHPSAKAVLSFEIPRDRVTPGDYSISIRPHAQPGSKARYYDFRVTIAK